MKLEHIDIDNLKPSAVNVRKRGGKDVADLLPSIRAIGLLQPLVVRPNCEGFEIVAGQRRYHALTKLAKEGADGPVPCIVMDADDDAKAIEASLAENIARLPMDEIDQYKAFSALIKQGRTAEEIAVHFGVTERLVNQRLAIANLYEPILNAYRKDDIHAREVRILTMATARQQKAWWKLHKSEDNHAPIGDSLKAWLFGGADIPVENALFDGKDYDGAIVANLFGDERYFDDAETFWALQNKAISRLKDKYASDGWPEVVVLDPGEHWPEWEHRDTPKKDGGRVYITCTRDGEVHVHEGFITKKEAMRKEKAGKGKDADITAPARPELTKAMQTYLDLHRHAAVRTALLDSGAVALRVAAAQLIAGSDLWEVKPEPQKACDPSTSDSLECNKAQIAFAEERRAVLEILGLPAGSASVVSPRESFKKGRDLASLLAKVLALSSADFERVLIFVIAETLPSGGDLVEALGKALDVDLSQSWQADDVFFDLLRDKEAINAILKEVAGKQTSDAYVSATAKAQKKKIRACLDGTSPAKVKGWTPRYAAFPMKAYTNRGGIAAIERWNAIKGKLGHAKAA
ncbi:MAG: ParB/RepB/Spo0J family partition protein [Cyanobacteria bacterium J06638_22]